MGFMQMSLGSIYYMWKEICIRGALETLFLFLFSFTKENWFGEVDKSFDSE